MNKKETVALFGLIAALYPRDNKFANPDAIMRDAWAEMLNDIPFDHAKAAVKAAVASSPFPPSISEIRDYATRLNKNRRMTADEAWAVASEVMREYGTRTVPVEGFKPEVIVVRFGEPVKPTPSGVEYEAKRHCPPDVWEHLRRMGYKDVCESENPDVVRGQFMRTWAAHDEEARETRVMGGVVPELVQVVVKQIGGSL
jgi:hypothetical protein